MATLQELMAQKDSIEKEIQAHRGSVILGMREQIAQFRITAKELGLEVSAPAAPAKRPVKYRDDQGNTWTGIGQRPRWLGKALLEGKTLEDFAVKQ